MKKVIAHTALAAIAVTLAVSTAVAAPSAELKVTGVIKPTACTPSFAGGGTLDYEIIQAGSLKPGEFTELPDKSTTLTITCDGPAKLALSAKDSRSTSVPEGFNTTFHYGLGAVAGKKVGGYYMFMNPEKPTTDGKNGYLMLSTDSNQTWTPVTGTGQIGKDRTFSFGASATANTPAAFRVFSADVRVVPYINKPEELPLLQDVPLDGLATFEVTYL